MCVTIEMFEYLCYRELGKKLREEQDEKRRLHEEGFKKREGFIAEASTLMEGKKV